MKLIKIIWFFRLVVYSLINPNISPYGYIGRPIYIHNLSRLIIRRRVRILPFSRFECHGAKSSIEIRENTSIGQNFHCTSNGALIIGSDTVISGNVCVTNIDHDYSCSGCLYWTSRICILAQLLAVTVSLDSVLLSKRVLFLAIIALLERTQWFVERSQRGRFWSAVRHDV